MLFLQNVLYVALDVTLDVKFSSREYWQERPEFKWSCRVTLTREVPRVAARPAAR